jgi:Protein of unknown function (DUF3341)
MKNKMVLASFDGENELLAAVRALRNQGARIIDVYSPYAVHGLDDALGWRRSRLPVACFLGGATGVILATWFQYWASAQDWPLNVGGRPWNSLPAFVPVIFECMVLFAGLGLVFAWLVRCGLYPGKEPYAPSAGVTDDRFVIALACPGSASDAESLQALLHECHAATIEERQEESMP